jgi:hypothetical protein
MANTRKAMRTIETIDVDPELLASVLISRSESEATVATTLLRYSLPDPELLQIVNLRELLRVLPTAPFRAGEGLEILERAAGYEDTGRSYRRSFDSAQGVFGVEFLGEGHACRGVVIHTPNGRHKLQGGRRTSVSEELLPVLIAHAIVLDAILEALELLGTPLDPTIYLAVDDFLAEHDRAMRSAFEDLF